jgi:hypothetical protein
MVDFGLTFTVSGSVAGNLFHHAIEFYLKGDLSRSVPRRDLRKRGGRSGHNLECLWKVYKENHSVSALSAFDGCITDLQKFETIRYPDAIGKNGMVFAIPVSRPQPPLDFSGGREHATNLLCGR